MLTVGLFIDYSRVLPILLHTKINIVLLLSCCAPCACLGGWLYYPLALVAADDRLRTSATQQHRVSGLVVMTMADGHPELLRRQCLHVKSTLPQPASLQVHRQQGGANSFTHPYCVDHGTAAHLPQNPSLIPVLTERKTERPYSD